MRFVLITFLLFFVVFKTSAQHQKTLQKRKITLQNQIKKINRLLSDSNKKKYAVLNRLQKLRTVSKAREKFIKNVARDIDVLNEGIKKTEQSIKTLSKNLKTLRKEYAKNIQNGYKYRLKQNRLFFILSAKDFYQGFLRFQYLKQYGRYTQKQVAKIIQVRTQLKEFIKELNTQKISKQTSLNEVEKEKYKNILARKKEKKLLSSIQKKSTKYKQTIRKKERQRRTIDREIQRIIRSAISKSNDKNRSSRKFALTPEAKILANDFAKNKGRLPWPVKTALVVRRFGKGIPHETVKGIKITSNGIHVATDKNSDVKSIFRGKVIAISVSGNGVKNILVQHGNYVSVYGNLHPVYVFKGDIVKSKQKIGKVHTNSVTGKTILKIQVWKGLNKQDPQKWLLRL